MLDDILQRYALVSHLLLACSFGHISTTVNGFYDIVTRFLSNKTCVAILYNYCLMLFIFCCKIPVMLFFGQLTQLEGEQLLENTRNYIMDTILFLVLSKPRYNGKEVLMSDLVKCITLLVSLKSFHIMLYIRLSHMFEVEVPRFFKIFRLSSFIYILSLVNCFLLNLFLTNINKKNTFTIWIIFELLGMLESLAFSTIKFIVNLIDLFQTSGLVNKVTLLFYIELLHDITSLVTFTIFMILFFLNNPINIPIYMIIDIIHVAKNLSGRIKMLIEYRKLSKVLGSRFPKATKEEIDKEITCIICRDNLDSDCRRIDCGHIYHLNCLKSWLFQHSTCPSCRSQIHSSPSTTPGGSLIDVNFVLFSLERRVISLFKWLYKFTKKVMRRLGFGDFDVEVEEEYVKNLKRMLVNDFQFLLNLSLTTPNSFSGRNSTTTSSAAGTSNTNNNTTNTNPNTQNTENRTFMNTRSRGRPNFASRFNFSRNLSSRSNQTPNAHFNANNTTNLDMNNNTNTNTTDTGTGARNPRSARSSHSVREPRSAEVEREREMELEREKELEKERDENRREKRKLNSLDSFDDSLLEKYEFYVLDEENNVKQIFGSLSFEHLNSSDSVDQENNRSMSAPSTSRRSSLTHVSKVLSSRSATNIRDSVNEDDSSSDTSDSDSSSDEERVRANTTNNNNNNTSGNTSGPNTTSTSTGTGTSARNPNNDNGEDRDNLDKKVVDAHKEEEENRDKELELYISASNVIKRRMLSRMMLLVPKQDFNSLYWKKYSEKNLEFRLRDRNSRLFRRESGSFSERFSEKFNEKYGKFYEKLTGRSNRSTSRERYLESMETSKEQLLLEGMFKLVMDSKKQMEIGLEDVYDKLMFVLPMLLSSLLTLLDEKDRSQLVRHLSTTSITAGTTFSKYGGVGNSSSTDKASTTTQGNRSRDNLNSNFHKRKTLTSSMVKKEHIKHLVWSENYYYMILKLKKERKLDFSNMLFNFQVMDLLLKSKA